MSKFRLYQHPWLSLLAVMVVSIFSIYLAGAVIFGIMGLPDDLPVARFTQQLSFHILTGFVLAPFVLRLPKGKSTFRQYLDDIGLSRIQPFLPLLLLAFSCSFILALSQAAASVMYRFFEGYPITGSFIRQVLDLSSLHPSNSPDLLLALPSAFEEVAFRGIALTVFLSRYSERKSIVFSSIGFSLMHLLNLTSGRELEWVLGQLVWSFLLGLFYGYAFVRTKSLMPPMIVHFLGNATISTFSGYMISQASTNVQILYQIAFSFGILPTTLMIWWTRFFTSRWLSTNDEQRSLDADQTAIAKQSQRLS
jgi:membrane protease YdiL (CAAX protease family)